MFVIFGVKVQFCEKEQEDEWLDISEMEDLRDEDARVFNIHQFGSFEVKIDFNDERSVERGRERMKFILEAEKECPVGQYFGAKGTGKGIVWQVVQCEGVPEMGAKYMEDRFWCKTKGVKHTEFRKEPKMKKVKRVKDEKMDSLLEAIVTKGKLEQVLQVLEREMLVLVEMKSLGIFIKWVYADVVKEEYDRIAEAGFEKDALKGPVAAVAKNWYIERMKEKKDEK
jgi:hypothetical protein